MRLSMVEAILVVSSISWSTVERSRTKAELFRDNDVVDLEKVTEFGGDNLV